MQNKALILLLLLITINQANAQIEKIGLKSFLDQAISQNTYTIEFLEKSISENSHYHSLLLNKAVRFKMFIDAQEYSSKLYSQNCEINSSEIGIINYRVKNTFSEGLKNSNYLFTVAEKKQPNLSNEFENIFNENIKNMSSLLKFTDLDCNNVLSVLQMRNTGIFNEAELGNNILSFNYLSNPVKEILDGYIQEFSSINNAPNENFFFTIDIPKSWLVRNKKEFNFQSTVALFVPYEKFLEANIVISIAPKPLITEKEMLSQNLTDDDLVDLIYEDNELLTSFLENFSLNNSGSKITCTLLNQGKHKMILFSNFNDDLGKSMDNEILDGQKMKTFGSLTFKNGKLISIICSGLNNSNFSSYEYYSKLFFKTITSLKFKDIKQNTIYLTEEQNMKFIELNFSNLYYKFMLDTGASNVVINKAVLSDLLTNGVLNKENYIGDSVAEIADGSMISCQNWLVPELKVGNQTLKNLTLSVIDSNDSMLLFGMDGLKKLNVLKMNLTENEIILNRE